MSWLQYKNWTELKFKCMCYWEHCLNVCLGSYLCIHSLGVYLNAPLQCKHSYIIVMSHRHSFVYKQLLPIDEREGWFYGWGHRAELYPVVLPGSTFSLSTDHTYYIRWVYCSVGRWMNSSAILWGMSYWHTTNKGLATPVCRLQYFPMIHTSLFVFPLEVIVALLS